MSGPKNWLDLETLRTISRHTSGTLAALISYIVISRTVEWAVGPGTFRDILEYVDKTVLIVIFLYFLLSVGYDLWRAIKQRGDD
jgi:hypothetical protein